MSRARNLADIVGAGEVLEDGAVGTLAAQESDNVSVTGGSVSGITDLSVADGGTGVSTASGARTSLGIKRFNFWTGS